MQDTEQIRDGKGGFTFGDSFYCGSTGRNEDDAGIPFVGKSGELFDRMLDKIGMCREEIYLTNIVKCHPPGNRDPKPEENGTLYALFEV